MNLAELKKKLMASEREQNQGSFDTAEQLANEVLDVLSLGATGAKSKRSADSLEDVPTDVSTFKEQLLRSELHSSALLRLAAIKYQRADYNNTLALAKQALASQRDQQLAIERARAQVTENILNRMLPASIAARMVDGEQEIADYFTSVSIMFADIVDFTPLSAEMPAYMVVRLLNSVFREFDRIMKEHGCEKIKTIGDGYLAVAGAPLSCEDHAERIVSAALEMQQINVLPDECLEYIPEGTRLKLRIGLHTGSVVAGVIGDERFVYDIYSDAVNVAARMESHGEPDSIHVTHDFVRHLQNRFSSTKNNSHGIVFEKRGEIEVKGKGLMKTYFLHPTPVQS